MALLTASINDTGRATEGLGVESEWQRGRAGPEVVIGWPRRRTGAVVYTALFGDYDDLREQPRSPGVEFVCFTDDPGLRVQGWDVRVRRPRYHHPRMAAKWYKLLAHRALPETRHAIWIDACVTLTAP